MRMGGSGYSGRTNPTGSTWTVVGRVRGQNVKTNDTGRLSRNLHGRLARP